MFKQVIANMDMAIFPTIALVLFLGVFIGATIWVFRKRSSEIYQEISLNALEDGQKK